MLKTIEPYITYGQKKKQNFNFFFKINEKDTHQKKQFQS